MSISEWSEALTAAYRKWLFTGPEGDLDTTDEDWLSDLQERAFEGGWESALATTGGETAGYMVVAKRPSMDGDGFDYADAGSIWAQVEPCENHQAYCQMAAEQDPERYGDVEYEIVRLSRWVPVDPTSPETEKRS